MLTEALASQLRLEYVADGFANVEDVAVRRTCPALLLLCRPSKLRDRAPSRSGLRQYTAFWQLTAFGRRGLIGLPKPPARAFPRVLTWSRIATRHR